MTSKTIGLGAIFKADFCIYKVNFFGSHFFLGNVLCCLTDSHLLLETTSDSSDFFATVNMILLADKFHLDTEGDDGAFVNNFSSVIMHNVNKSFLDCCSCCCCLASKCCGTKRCGRNPNQSVVL